MAKNSIKVVVAGRAYPLSVEEGEEARVLKAAEDINKAIKVLQNNYAVRDMQDLLAMTALQLASRSEKGSAGKEAPDLTGIEERLSGLLSELDS